MFKDIKSVRKRAGLTQGELAARAGMDRPNLSAIESGRRTMSMKLADRVLEALDEDDSPGAEDLVIANRIRAFQNAKKNGDLERMFDSATAVIKAGAATPGALPLFHEMISDIEAEIDEADDEDDGRDLFGRVLPVLKDSGDEDDEDDGRDMYGRVVSSPRNHDGDDDGMDDGRDMFGRVMRSPSGGDDEDDGRDMFGRVIRPVDQDDDDDEEEYEDDDDLEGVEEDNRDIYGRKIR
jgi:transcriptional regulator with XRE-family HTH domain